ncbi:hypothetical protein Cni_G28953 [Canna indica]|uniref:Transposase n=1 Tax=Canna indica TaxID=4628 RepID=A0AAQ3QP77_9LILI|nr:hypothetical protein Cni_G28953 [Canna indica]
MELGTIMKLKSKVMMIVLRVEFNDSKEEREKDGDYFVHYGVIEPIEDGSIVKTKGGKTIGPSPQIEATVNGLATIEEIDGQYDSEELDSLDSYSDSESGRKPRYPRYRKEEMGKDFKLQLGMEFTSTKEFKEIIQEYALLNGRAIKLKKNDAKRVRLTCQGSCEFIALCSRVDKTSTFRLKTLVDKHTCNRVFNNKNAKSSWVAEKVVDKVRGSSKTKLSEIIAEIQSKYSAGISIHTAFNELKKAKNIVEGTTKEQYANLPRYLAEILRASNHNTCKLQIERPQENLQPIFQRLYMCFEGSKKGFLQDCRLFIGVDGCHLKTKYDGVLLVALGRDANNQYFPLTFAMVEFETKESWKFFLKLLLDDIGDGLLPVFDELLHGVEHRFCLRHLYNFKKKFGAWLMMKALMHGAAKTNYTGAHREKMEQIKAINNAAYD